LPEKDSASGETDRFAEKDSASGETDSVLPETDSASGETDSVFPKWIRVLVKSIPLMKTFLVFSKTDPVFCFL
jgi:hypothetical protein